MIDLGSDPIIEMFSDSHYFLSNSTTHQCNFDAIKTKFWMAAGCFIRPIVIVGGFTLRQRISDNGGVVVLVAVQCLITRVNTSL